MPKKQKDEKPETALLKAVQRITISLPLSVLSELQDLAEREQRSISNLAALLVQVGLNALAIGEFNTLLLNTAEDKTEQEN